MNKSSIRVAIIIFVVTRLLLSLWAVAALTVSPLPDEPDETLRPYLGLPPLPEGAAGWLLGPWQRFDALHYVRIADQGYANAADSVFPPLYPLLMRGVGDLLRGIFTADGAGTPYYLLAGIMVSNAAFVVALAVLHRLTAAEMDEPTATRTVVYLSVFPTGFFLLAPYSESLFLALAVAAVWSARRGRPWLAGFWGLLASLTRLTGWALAIPVAYEAVRQRNVGGRPSAVGGLLAAGLPFVGLAGFLAYRTWAGLPPLNRVYQHYWYQVTGFPGRDALVGLQTLIMGGATRSPLTLAFDLLCIMLLAATTIVAFRRLGVTCGVYSTVLLFFILLPTSDLKPLYSFSRYALVFFPTFMMMGATGRNPWLNRLIIYPSLALYLYFSSQFFVWGWVA